MGVFVMYAVTRVNNKTILQVLQPCSKKFIVNGQLVNIPKSGIIVFDKKVKICVGKILHHEFHKIQMAKNKQILYHNSTILQHEMGKMLTLAEKEILLSSIEIEETI